MIIILAILLISILGILKVLNKLQTVTFLCLALIYYLLSYFGNDCKILIPFFDKYYDRDMKLLEEGQKSCGVNCKVPKDVYMANRRWANLVPLNVHDDYGWGDAAFGSAGGGANSKIEMPEVGNWNVWHPPSPKWYGW